ncbi:MAG: hypothetical protein JSC189_000557 [Candidatus Tokpelaia sp. JSC189]|nr:MAG: hypothetical protein JSC189_000557 [Candidatus Tokpelaia sp. JSC189]
MKIQHGNALHLGGFGLLIIGLSGSGKSVLTLALIERSHLFGRKAALVGDDYVELENMTGQLFAYAPLQIAGVIEVRGAGLFKMAYEEKTRLDLVIELDKKGERYPEEHFFENMQVRLPLLKLPQLRESDVLGLCYAVEATLFGTRWQLESAEKGV